MRVRVPVFLCMFDRAIFNCNFLPGNKLIINIRENANMFPYYFLLNANFLLITV